VDSHPYDQGDGVTIVVWFYATVGMAAGLIMASGIGKDMAHPQPDPTPRSQKIVVAVVSVVAIWLGFMAAASLRTASYYDEPAGEVFIYSTTYMYPTASWYSFVLGKLVLASAGAAIMIVLAYCAHRYLPYSESGRAVLDKLEEMPAGAQRALERVGSVTLSSYIVVLELFAWVIMAWFYRQ
jgi:hypothetical protein